MLPKPKHLSPEYAAVFGDASVVAAYHNRPPYPREAIGFLAGLLAGRPRSVLDVGCGTGDIARPLAEYAEHLDAADISAPMIERARSLPGGEHPAIRWIRAPVEEAPLEPGYGLITAGESLHWMDWQIVLPRFAEVLYPSGFVAIVERDWERVPELRERFIPLVQRYTTNRDFRPYDLIEELETRGLFGAAGTHTTAPVAWQPTIEEYIEMRHSQNGLSRERMGETAARFDEEMRGILEDLVRDGTIERRGERLQLSVTATIVWGKPLPGAR